MALSRISSSEMMNTLIRVSRGASLEIQHAIPDAIHRRQQRMETLHMTCIRRYPDPPTLNLPNNMRNISDNETGRFGSERARDIALYSENGGVAITTNSTGFPKIYDDSHLPSYDCFGAVNLCGTMQTNVPKPYHSRGNDTWVLRSTHLNMPGGQWNRSNKYIAEDMQKSHYRNLRSESCFYTTNTLITSSILRAINRVTYTRVNYYSTDISKASKDNMKDQVTVTGTMSKRERFRILLKHYGSVMLIFHICISIISLGTCYMVIMSGVDIMPFVQKITGGNDKGVDTLMKTSTDFVIAYTVHKLLAPLRISLTLSVTPLFVRRLRSVGVLKMPKTPPPL